jgi:hypothetical protein
MTTKKKINVNTLANTGAKSIDSFFTISSTLQSTPNLESQSQSQLSDQLSSQLSSQLSQDVNNNVQNTMPDTRENVLKNLVQHKILYGHFEIKNKIDNLSEDEMTEIFKIIKNNNEKYSTNKNGIFINLSTLKKNTIQEISNFLYFCDNNNKAIINEEIERAKYKEMFIDN